MKENVTVGRVRQAIEVAGRDCWTLFDSGARNTYITRDVASLLGTSPTSAPIRIKLGGAARDITEETILKASVEGYPVSTHALVIDEIETDEEGRRIDVLFGALAMQQWGIRPVPDEERIDLTHYPTEFVEF